MNMERHKILLVEDNVPIRTAVSSLLERHGFEVHQAGDGEEALKKVDEVDVVLLDIFLPRCSGDEFLKQVRGKGNYVPVVLMSAAMPEPQAQEYFKEFKVVDFVSKPFKSKELLEKINKATAVANDMKVVKNTADRLRGFINRQASL